MRVRNSEINRRRHRQQKRKKLRRKLAATTDATERKAVEAKILKTYPNYTTEIPS